MKSSITNDKLENLFSFVESFFTEIGVVVLAKATQVHLPKRAFEKEMTSHLFCHFLHDNKLKINHLPSGKPFLENHPKINISISHSAGYFAIYYSEKKAVGIDIQVFKPIIIQQPGYFLNENEIKNPTWLKNSIILHQIWCAKEALYKLLGGDISSMKDDFTVSIVDADKLTILYKNQLFEAKSMQKDDCFIVFLHKF
jgi:phosphopantetheinyl transferase